MTGPPERPQTPVRIQWWDGLYRLECRGAGADLRLAVYEGDVLVVEEPIESATAAVRRGRTITDQLRRGERPGAERGSA